MVWIFFLGLIIVLLLTVISLMKEEIKRLKAFDKLHNEAYKVLLARAIEQSVESGRMIQKEKLEKFIESSQITDDYLGSILVTAELKEAIKAGVLQKNGGKVSEM